MSASRDGRLVVVNHFGFACVLHPPSGRTRIVETLPWTRILAMQMCCHLLFIPAILLCGPMVMGWNFVATGKPYRFPVIKPTDR